MGTDDFRLVFGYVSGLADRFIADAATAGPHRNTTHKTLPGYCWNWWRREHITISVQQQSCSMMWLRRARRAVSHFALSASDRLCRRTFGLVVGIVPAATFLTLLVKSRTAFW